ncbi:MAG: class I SAM-dependent methyltransferase [Flavobacteriales bacterium]
MSTLSHHLRAYLRHLQNAGNRHDVHSPFVYALVVDVLRKRGSNRECSDIEQLRTELLKRSDIIHITDLGAGSQRSNIPDRKVRDIARTALKPRAQAEMLFRLARYFKPRTILELGTSFGITTLYLARAARDAAVHTIEGSPSIAAIAQQNFKQLDASNIVPHVGSFHDRLPEVLRGLERLDMIFIDGHHAKTPTLENFECCLSNANNESVFIFDDIHWSPEMEEAWEAIKTHTQVTVTIDLLHMGLVFLRKEQQREHFRLRY